MAFRQLAPDELSNLKPLEATQPSGVTDVVQPNIGGSMVNTGAAQDDLMRQLLIYSLFSGDTSAADISALSSLGLFEKPPTTNKAIEIREQQQNVAQARSDIQDALTLLNSLGDENVSGPAIAARRKLLGEAPGSSGDVDALLSVINQRLRAIAGAAITGTEKSLLEGGIPELGLQEDTLKTTLERLDQELERDQGALKQLPGADPSIQDFSPRSTSTGGVNKQANLPSQNQNTPVAAKTSETTKTTPPSQSGTNFNNRNLGKETNSPLGNLLRGVVESDRIPDIGGSIAGLITAPLNMFGIKGSAGGTAAGTAGGEVLQQNLENLLGIQDQSPSEQLKEMALRPTRNAAIAYGSERILPALFPKATIKLRNFLAGRNPATISGEQIAEDVINSSSNFPVTANNTVDSLGLNAIDRFAGNTYTIPQALDELATANRAGYTLGGNAGRPLTAQFNNEIGNAIRSQIAQRAPTVSLINSLYGAGQGIRRGVGGFLKNAILPVAAGLGIGKLLGRD